MALVTGATRGIGFETARQLGQKGIAVVVGGRAQQEAKTAADKLAAENIEAYPVAGDVTKDADRKAAARFISEKFGKLDILVHNAGVGGKGGLLNPHTIETTEEERHDHGGAIHANRRRSNADKRAGSSCSASEGRHHDYF